MDSAGQAFNIAPCTYPMMRSKALPRLPRFVSLDLDRRINRGPSPTLAFCVPWFAIMLGSMAPVLPVITQGPFLPPFGFLALLAWRHVRPGLLPVWSGLPLGLFDDIFSGQPFGCGVMLWSLAILVLDAIEARFAWRSFVQDWLSASALIVAYLAMGLAIANAAGAATPLLVILPQLVLSILLYPLVCRMIGSLDQFRLLPFAELG